MLVTKNTQNPIVLPSKWDETYDVIVVGSRFSWLSMVVAALAVSPSSTALHLGVLLAKMSVRKLRRWTLRRSVITQTVQ